MHVADKSSTTKNSFWFIIKFVVHLQAGGYGFKRFRRDGYGHPLETTCKQGKRKFSQKEIEELQALIEKAAIPGGME